MRRRRPHVHGDFAFVGHDDDFDDPEADDEDFGDVDIDPVDYDDGSDEDGEGGGGGGGGGAPAAASGGGSAGSGAPGGGGSAPSASPSSTLTNPGDKAKARMPGGLLGALFGSKASDTKQAPPTASKPVLDSSKTKAFVRAPMAFPLPSMPVTPMSKDSGGDLSTKPSTLPVMIAPRMIVPVSHPTVKTPPKPASAPPKPRAPVQRMRLKK